MISRLKLYFNTLRYLKPIQIYYRLIYYLWKPDPKNYKNKFKSVSFYPLELGTSLFSDTAVSKNTFTFLNQSKTFASTIDWDFAGFGKLWTYHLNYFDFLNQTDLEFETGRDLIIQFMDQADHIKAGLEAYPTSLRGINWIRFISRYHKLFAPFVLEQVSRSLYLQYTILSKRIEYHILGNHLLENGFSLLFAAYFFKDKKFLNQAFKILKPQLKEQTLKDGAHFERSPMYHQIILNRLLDCCDLVQNNPWPAAPDTSFLLKTAEKMLGWLNAITFSNNNIPMVNDAAHGMAPDTGRLNKKADSLGIRIESSILSESGYRKYKTESYECLVDAGPLGPDYQPGHGHADTFSFVLNIKGKPIIVDTGISTYEKNDRRQLERATSSHNTVQINSCDSSEVWGGFRVARRAKVTNLVETATTLRATHNGYRHLGVFHTRQFEFSDSEIRIKDNISSKTDVSCEAFLHFAPDLDLRINNNFIESALFSICFRQIKALELVTYEFASGFNRLRTARSARIAFEKHLTTIIELKK